mmetsp:Transcript_25618/g.82965  ORF Transcript_25618/g.82965 Transcript_25618/m.82965 type:complete len:375 (-) Transcript_25618:206-1330(-)
MKMLWVVFLLVLCTKASALGGGGFRVLEWVPSQQMLVKSAKFGWTTAFRTMMEELAPQSKEGDYLRPSPQRGTGKALRLDGSYAAYVGNACPWCHRVALGVALRQPRNVRLVELEDDATEASRGGWIMKTTDPVFGKRDLKQVYDAAASKPGGYEGRCTAPLLVDVDAKTIVSQESGDILRALCDVDANDIDLRPPDLASHIDALNEKIYLINDGTYRCGFATTQRAYDRAYADLHAAMKDIEDTLDNAFFLLGDKITEADLRLYPTIARFDVVYATLFRCGGPSLALRYPHIDRWRARMLAIPGVDATLDAHAAAASYYKSLFPLNPSGVVPKPPAVLEEASSPLLDDKTLNTVDDLLTAGLAFPRRPKALTD